MSEEPEGIKIDNKSIELMEKWQQQAKVLKKKHPKWNAAKIQQEMKDRIVREAQAAISPKDAKVYIQEMNSHLKKIEDARQKAITSIMHYMGRTSPEAVGTVLFELDCGCLRACAVSEEGGPMGEMLQVSGRPDNEEAYTCELCDKDGGADTKRCINKALIWPGEEADLPSEEFRLSIGKKVFGDDYSLEDI